MSKKAAVADDTFLEVDETQAWDDPVDEAPEADAPAEDEMEAQAAEEPADASQAEEGTQAVFVAHLYSKYGNDFLVASNKETALRWAAQSAHEFLSEFSEKDQQQLKKLLREGKFEAALKFYNDHHPEKERLVVDEYQVFHEIDPEDLIDFSKI